MQQGEEEEVEKEEKVREEEREFREGPFFLKASDACGSLLGK